MDTTLLPPTNFSLVKRKSYDLNRVLLPTLMKLIDVYISAKKAHYNKPALSIPDR